ncbi:DUF1054 family protein, partial [Bacillus sp. WP8]|uniref:DUF1054 family protein n=1 Tax=Bacillus sp. WP8 TaxID=756828 RepID=UPI0011A58662
GMSVLKERVGGKVEGIGEDFGGVVCCIRGEEMFVEVGKDGRRCVKGRNDRWVGFGKSKGGYKKVGDFEMGVWKRDVFV